MEKSLIISLIVLIMINVTDSISNSIIGPSLIFYVVEMGGTKSQYGMIMSSSFLSGIIMMGVYGKWIDSNGNKYKQPYMASFGLGILGSLVYFLAILLPKGKLAVATILLGRFITGMGAASRTLAYSYVATAIPRDQQRTILTMMSMTRSFGMMLGPLMNLLVSKVDTSLVLYKDITITVNQNNSVGLIIASGEIFLCTIMFLFLKDPQQLKTQEKEEVIGTTTKRRSLLISSSSMSKDNEQQKQQQQQDQNQNQEKPAEAGFRDILELSVRCFDLFLPLVTMFVFMFNFSLYAVTIPPVGNHALGWDPVMISNVLAVQAVVLFIGMCASMVCSMKDVSDFYMIGFGNLCFVIGGTATYVYWTSSSSSSTVAAALKFAIPIFIVSFSYPFLGPANRSKFTKAVHNHKELENKHGAMQALFNQAFMLAGFISPSFVAAFVLRSPNDIDSSDNKHELTSLAWYIPISSSILILLLIYEEFVLKKNELGFVDNTDGGDNEIVSESSKLLTVDDKKNSTTTIGTTSRRYRRSSLIEIQQTFSREFEVYRRASVEVNGIPNFVETSEEITHRDSLWKDKEEWDELERIDAAIEETERNE